MSEEDSLEDILKEIAKWKESKERLNQLEKETRSLALSVCASINTKYSLGEIENKINESLAYWRKLLCHLRGE